MFERLLLPWQQIYHFAFYSIFRTTLEVSSKLYFVEICKVSQKLWLFNHKRPDFWLDLKVHISASLILCKFCWYLMMVYPVQNFIVIRSLTKEIRWADADLPPPPKKKKEKQPKHVKRHHGVKMCWYSENIKWLT